MTLKLQLRELMEAKAAAEGRVITQKTVSEETGIDQGVISRYARGFVTNFNSDILEKLLDYFQVELNELIIRER